jgi:HD domain
MTRAHLDLKAATQLAHRLLASSLPIRWAHSLGVLRQAQNLEARIGGLGGLAVAAIVHDVGYSADAQNIGQHMIDGATYLRDVVGAPSSICSMVAYHSTSRWESQELGLVHVLAQFTPPVSLLEDAITYCDLTTGPMGAVVDPTDRLAEVLTRYGATSVVHRAVAAARPTLLASATRIRQLLVE